MTSIWSARDPLVLASRSSIRFAMVQAAGIPVEVVVADVDERAVEKAAGPLDPLETAAVLARAKALAVSRKMTDRLVLGCDQTLAFGARRFDKPLDRAAARVQLKALVGRTHQLHAAVALAHGGAVIFEDSDTASLTMRQVSDTFLDRYLEMAGDAVLDSVGAYQLEKLGSQLLERIEGDHFTILGLPLLRLFALLRREGSLLA